MRTSLATETDYVRGRLSEYTNDLLSLGIDGLRLDAAKRAHRITSRYETFYDDLRHTLADMDPDDIADILSRLTAEPYVTQEVRFSLENCCGGGP